MKSDNFDELEAEHEKTVLGLQYTIAQRERLKALISIAAVAPPEKTNKILRAANITPSERLQDIFALLANGSIDGGYFVEFGACDGLKANNTVTLERLFGWKGLLVEPITFWHKRLKWTRSATIDKRCVSATTGEQITMYQATMPGNSSVHPDHPYLGDVSLSYQVETVSLLDLLREHDAPRHINFLSVDTEGHEFNILSAFDFDEYRFGFICVEQHERAPDDVTPLLVSAGYRPVLPREAGRPIPMQISGEDLFFVPADHPLFRDAAKEWQVA